MDDRTRIPPGHDARSAPPRERRILNATLRAPRFGSAEAVVRNISAGGLGGSTRIWLCPGEPVEAMLPGIGAVAAVVAWADGTRFGLRFDGPIAPARVTRDRAQGMDPGFRVMDRYRPAGTAWRPGLTRR
ncbi:hypothetical protein ACFQ1E_13860 [Sphingomonas canadensis]|uniref:PilZ domain-containing protein n=1 Tax=Sphingomonas canadensis TaxID=1219257 RepID=A0ABW3H7F7_9SPHN|nr:hypothetical protein [Sphingomonas canadensis]MCW3837331.1 hypothetical protein [Sphingomonas canadensis]